MRRFSYLLFLLLLVAAIDGFAQGVIKTEYMPASSFRDEAGNKLGSGDLLKFTGAYTLPFSLKQNASGQPIMWSASARGTYAILNNRHMVLDIHQDEVLSGSLNLTHVRPLSKKWYMIASLGAGIYSAPDAITWQSVLVNGGVIFVYKCRKNPDIGVGARLTNSFGVPIAMPMFFLNWQLSGNYEVNVNLSSGVEVSGAVRLGDRFKLRLVAMEMDGISSVMDVEGKSMIYASVMMRSYLCPEYRIGKKSCLYLGIGGNWLRSGDLTKRTLKGFVDNMFSDKDDPYFNPTVYFSAGVKCGF